MQLSCSLIFLALAISANAQAFKGSPAGGGSPPTTLSFPNCAKTCLDTPKGNFIDQFQSFCNAVPTKDCCITSACGSGDKDLTYRISVQICDYIGKPVASFSCPPTSTPITAATSASLPGFRQNAAVAASSSSKSSSAHPSTHSTSQTSTHPSSSLHSTSQTSTHPSSSPHSTPHSSTLSTLLTSVRSSTPISSTHTSTTPQRSSAGSSTSTAPAAAHSTLSVYDGFVGAYCYTEGTSGRALTGATTSSPTNMTIESCLNFCEKAGYGWAGVENSSECYCGYGMTNGAARADNSVCNLGCSGNPSENCGGAKALSVYESG